MNNTSTIEPNSNSGKFIEPRNVAMSKDRQYVLIFLPNGQIIRKHVNLFKAAMGLPYVKRGQAPADI